MLKQIVIPAPTKKATKLKKRRKERRQSVSLGIWWEALSFTPCSAALPCAPFTRQSPACIQKLSAVNLCYWCRRKWTHWTGWLPSGHTLLTWLRPVERVQRSCRWSLSGRSTTPEICTGTREERLLWCKPCSVYPRTLSERALFYAAVFHGAFAMSLMSSFSCSPLDVAPPLITTGRVKKVGPFAPSLYFPSVELTAPVDMDIVFLLILTCSVLTNTY